MDTATRHVSLLLVLKMEDSLMSAILYLYAGYRGAVLGRTISSDGKEHFGPTGRTGQNAPKISAWTKQKWSVPFDF